MRKRIITLKASSLLIIALLFSSCDKHGTEINSSDEPLMSGVQVISESEAINTLQRFLSNMEEATRSEQVKSILSVETHFSDRLITRSGKPIPDAYLVNFANKAGFAVLGANTSVDSIIFVIDEGSATWDTILSDKKTTDSWITKDNILSLCLSTALRGREQPIDTSDNPAPEEDTTGTGGNHSLNIAAKTLNLPFNQIRTYCHKANGDFVVSGCSAVAQAIVAAYNEFPNMYIDGELIDYGKCDTADSNGFYYECTGPSTEARTIIINPQDYFFNYYDVPDILMDDDTSMLLSSIDPDFFTSNHSIVYCIPYNNNPFKRTRFKLISAMFFNTNNTIVGWGATGAMPSAVSDALEDLGYTNVTTSQSFSINYSQQSRIINMLIADKPVIMCGWGVNLSQSHYWVVDGWRHASSSPLIHCNWGWGGSYNGWFSISCIRKTEGFQYDDPNTYASGQHSTSQWLNLITYTYDIPSTVPSFHIFPSSNYKTTYGDQ